MTNKRGRRLKASKQITIRLPDELMEFLLTAGKTFGLNLNDYIRTILYEAKERNGKHFSN